MEQKTHIGCPSCGVNNALNVLTGKCGVCGHKEPQIEACEICLRAYMGNDSADLTECGCGAKCCPSCIASHGCVHDLEGQGYFEFHPEGEYRVWRIPKKNGTYRIIEEPNPELKDLQKKILRVLMRLRPTLTPYAHGFMRYRSIVTNARRHLIRRNGKETGPDCLLKVDLKNFFPSVTDTMVEEAARAWRIPEYVIESILDACFRKGRLPQGAPTSPFLANLAAARLDYRIAGLTKKWRSNKRYQSISYARYADDLSFGSNYPRLIDLIHPIRNITKQAGFKVNEEKVEFHRKPAQLRVCGVVINDKLSVDRKYWRSLRAIIHGATTDILSGTVEPGFVLAMETRKKIREVVGILGHSGVVPLAEMGEEASAIVKENKGHPIPWSSWAGQIAFIRSVDPKKGQRFKEAFDNLRRLHERESDH